MAGEFRPGKTRRCRQRRVTGWTENRIRETVWTTRRPRVLFIYDGEPSVFVFRDGRFRWKVGDDGRHTFPGRITRYTGAVIDERLNRRGRHVALSGYLLNDKKTYYTGTPDFVKLLRFRLVFPSGRAALFSLSPNTPRAPGTVKPSWNGRVWRWGAGRAESKRGRIP